MDCKKSIFTSMIKWIPPTKNNYECLINCSHLYIYMRVAHGILFYAINCIPLKSSFIFKIHFICFFNWRIIALQCCVGFCDTAVWLSLPPTSLIPPPPGCPGAPSWTSPWLFCTWYYVYVSAALVCASPLLLPHLYPPVCSLCQHLCFFPENKFISTTFLDSTYVCQCMIFVFLLLSDFTLYNRR